MNDKSKSTAKIQLRLPPKEKARFIERAQEQGFKLTTWIRLTLRKAAGMDKK